MTFLDRLGRAEAALQADLFSTERLDPGAAGDALVRIAEFATSAPVRGVVVLESPPAMLLSWPELVLQLGPPSVVPWRALLSFNSPHTPWCGAAEFRLARLAKRAMVRWAWDDVYDRWFDTLPDPTLDALQEQMLSRDSSLTDGPEHYLLLGPVGWAIEDAALGGIYGNRLSGDARGRVDAIHRMVRSCGLTFAFRDGFAVAQRPIHVDRAEIGVSMRFADGAVIRLDYDSASRRLAVYE